MTTETESAWKNCTLIANTPLPQITGLDLTHAFDHCVMSQAEVDYIRASADGTLNLSGFVTPRESGRALKNKLIADGWTVTL